MSGATANRKYAPTETMLREMIADARRVQEGLRDCFHRAEVIIQRQIEAALPDWTREEAPGER